MGSSSDIVIKVENLSKRYRIGPRQARYHTFREAIVDTLAAPWSSLRRAWKQGADFDNEPGNNTIWALKNISLEVRRGDILGLIGRNGAGKTTLLKVLSRITEPTAGRAVLRGRVGSLLEVGTGFHPELTGRENIFLNGAILGMTQKEIEAKFEEIVNFAEMGKFLDTPLKRYSTGMGARLAFAIAAHLDTEIMLVDEVLAVGDLGFRKRCLGKMKDLTHGGRTVIFVSHEMNAIRRLCKNAVWLEGGQVRAQGEVQEVVSQYEATFLGQNIFQACRVDREIPADSDKCFSWASLATAAGEPANVFKFGDTLRLTIGMAGQTPHNHFVEWWLTETNQGGRVAWGASHVILEEDVPGDAQEISFVIGPLPLAAGNYSFSLAMGVPAMINLDNWPDALSFEITGSDPQGTGYHYTTRYAPTIIPYQIETFKP
jgi:lipopolysaccharide transport system ATP-binding protein